MKSTLGFAVVLTVIIPSVLSTVVIDSYNDDSKVVSIPLVKMKSGLQNLMEMGFTAELIGSLQRMANKQIRINGQDSNDTLPLYKYFDSEYYGTINIGKPGRPFRMVFDTVWAHSWVPSIECPKIKLPCAIHNRYDHTVSSTYVKDGKKFNASGEFIGYFSKDVFTVGQKNSTNQSFAEISSLPWINSLVKSDGIVGLGVSSGSPDYVPFFYNFLKQNHFNNGIFSFYINRDPTTPHGGSILFGGINPKHKKGDFTTLDITNDFYWTFKMTKVSLIISSKKNVDFCVNGCTATADTSTNVIVGPPDDIREINDLIRAEPFIMGRSLIPCVMEYKGPKLNFTIGGTNFQILGRDYVQKLSYSGFTVCLSAFQEASKGSLAVSDWRLGGAFLYQFYTAYDVLNKKFMIAEAA